MMNPVNQDDIIYFVVTDRFFGQNKESVDPADALIHGGTLDGIIAKLDYLIELGITAIWVTPVYENIPSIDSAEPYHYYWAQDFNKIDERLLDGSELSSDSTELTTFGEFVDKCEARGIKVVLDMVVNHCGYGAEERFDPNWFQNGEGEIEGPLAGLPDFDHDNTEVVDFFIQNIKAWITEGKISNIRMDTVKHVEPKFWHYFKSQIQGEFPDIFMVGEILVEDKDSVNKIVEYQNFHDFDSVFDFPLCTALRSTLIYDESLSYWLARPRLNDNEPLGVLDNDNPFKGGYRNPNQLVTLLDNHDLQQRIMSHARTKHRGNGAGLDFAIKVTKLCLGALFTVRGIPQLYYGTEIGLEGWKREDSQGDRDLRRDFPWNAIGLDNQPLPGLNKERDIYDWTKALISLRKRSKALRYGTTITLWSSDLVYAFLRVTTEDVAFVIINNGYLSMSEPLNIFLNPSIISPRVIELITNGLTHWQTNETLTVQNNNIEVQVDAKTIDIYVL
ncbi:MAG: alpha-amylase family glycosyl hydrolase [Waterburya sp.]